MSPIDNTPPSIRKQPARSDYRLRDLERARVPATSAINNPGNAFPGFSFPGPAVLGEQSPRWYSHDSRSYVQARISSVFTGSPTTSFGFALNGTLLLTLSLLAGENTHLFVAVFSIVAGDYFEAYCSDDAGGHDTISIQLEESA